MKAYVLDVDGAGIRDVPVPVPGPGQALVRVTAAGLCHSDVTLAARPASSHPFVLPLILGHELAGSVEACGSRVRNLDVGSSVVGYGPRGCGRCEVCRSGNENYCRTRPAEAFSPGLGAPGALAEFVCIDADHLVTTRVSPVQGAALSDAGLTSFSALNRIVRMLPDPASSSLVILGVGGLGHVFVQLARAAGFATIVAVDVDRQKLDLARRSGATHTVLSSSSVVDDVRDVVGSGADAVVDFVANQATLDTAAACVAVNGIVSIVGVGAGRLAVGMHALPFGTRVDLPYWGGRGELEHLLQMAERGVVTVTTDELPLDDVALGYERLEAGQVMGRIVVRP